MSNVTFEAVSKRFGAVAALDSLDLAVESGEFVSLLGPSGSGKTTTLNLLAGLLDADGGIIRIDGRDVTPLPPDKRDIAMVFQNYALYPHMTVFENMAFSLRYRGFAKAEIRRRVDEAARILEIEPLLARMPRQLSGGQRQRVAIGRAIVRKPQVFLFDEPLSNLDAALRVRMRYEFAALHKALGTTMIYVTHDQVEAMTLADKIVVLSTGRVEQVGTPAELYEHPETAFVAGFIGSPRMNLLAVTIVSNGPSGAIVRLSNGLSIRTAIDASRAGAGSAATLGIRPEHVVLEGEANRVPASVRFVESLGSAHFGYLDVAGEEEPLTCALSRRLETGSAATIGLPPDRLYLFDAAGRAFARSKLASEGETL